MVIKVQSGDGEDLGWLGAEGRYYDSAEEAHRSFQRRRTEELLEEASRLQARVGEMLSRLGAIQVTMDVNISGIRLDILVREVTLSGAQLRTAVEVRSSRGDESAVRPFAALVERLRRNGEVDTGMIVSPQGFTEGALSLAASAGLRLFSVEELERLSSQARQPQVPASVQREPPSRLKVFVIMPFEAAFDDVFFEGIRGAVDDAGMVCQRADELIALGDVMQLVEAEIQRADIIIAELTSSNPNVFFEAGITHALGRPLVTIVQRASEVPFDLSHRRHIEYRADIAMLRQRLATQLEALKKQLQA